MHLFVGMMRAGQPERFLRRNAALAEVERLCMHARQSHIGEWTNNQNNGKTTYIQREREREREIDLTVTLTLTLTITLTLTRSCDAVSVCGGSIMLVRYLTDDNCTSPVTLGESDRAPTSPSGC